MGVIIHYQLNKAYIVENYCVNIDKPELMCSGKCYLFDELEEQENKSKDAFLNSEDKKITYTFKKRKMEGRLVKSNNNHASNFLYLEPNLRSYSYQRFLPPKFL